MSKKRPKELDQPEIGNNIKYLWRWFCELSSSRPVTKTRYSALGWAEIKAWAELTDRKPDGWEISTIRAMDKEFLNG